MNNKFSLSRLSGVFNEALIRNEPTIAFEIQNGKGRFLFMMFFGEEDNDSKDQLFLFMKNTMRMIQLKMYGNHSKGQFDIYVNHRIVNWIKEELGILNSNSGNPFDLASFFSDINFNIPQNLPLTNKINILRDNWENIKEKVPENIIEESDKKYLIGPKVLKLPRRPRERTLRKLYLYSNETPENVENLIASLKRLNITLAWSKDKNFSSTSINSIFKKIS
ncbi:hypothetical protein [Aquimarina agarilytica]|uniref:hypothetical protein n=1 Tax=Aquimarina agarilytica TaxID=1087449 RepID=UPI000289D78C|nr:hypothetical protein [Aquimarina agarilytica]